MSTAEKIDNTRRHPVDGHETAKALRKLADVTSRLDLPDAHVSATAGLMTHTPDDLKVDVHCRDLDQLREARRAVGMCRKEETSSGLVLRAEVDGVQVTLWPPHGTCERVQVGTETVERQVPTSTETVTEEVPVYEWDCPDVLADEPLADAMGQGVVA